MRSLVAVTFSWSPAAKASNRSGTCAAHCVATAMCSCIGLKGERPNRLVKVDFVTMALPPLRSDDRSPNSPSCRLCDPRRAAVCSRFQDRNFDKPRVFLSLSGQDARFARYFAAVSESLFDIHQTKSLQARFAGRRGLRLRRRSLGLERGSACASGAKMVRVNRLRSGAQA